MDFVVDPEEGVYPIVPPGKNLCQMELRDNDKESAARSHNEAGRILPEALPA
jgi:hypothetical protein